VHCAPSSLFYRINAQWRKEIRARISEKVSSRLKFWKQQCTNLTARLTAANDEIVELKAQVAKLETRLESSTGTRP